MPLTNFPNGITSFGIPVYGSIPAIRGQYYFVDPTAGSNGNSGKELSRALADVANAYSKCSDGVGDGIILLSRGSTAAATTSYLTEELAWAKNGITMVGLAAPVMMFGRARISNLAASTTLAQLITISGANNAWYNVHLFNGGSDATALGGLKVTGIRNYFSRCHVVGAGHATPGVTVDAHNLELNGASENMFEDCVFGTDTINRVGDVANYDILLTAGCARNYFRRCMTLSQTTSGNAAHLAIKFGGAGDGINRNQYFEDCSLINYNAGAVSNETSAVGGTLPNNGKLVFLGQTNILGYAALDSAGAATAYVSTAAAAATGGLMAGG